jgi:hypothetical protein
MLLNLLIFSTSECTQLYSPGPAAHTNFADKENVFPPLFGCAPAIQSMERIETLYQNDRCGPVR